jgi:peroxiredoxin Q/BCP
MIKWIMEKHKTSLREGEKAPAFSGIDQNGKTHTLKDYKGKKLIIYFYPKDDTPGCTAQACNLRDNYKLLQKNGFSILGVSADDEKKHLKFIKKYDLPFPLIADTNHEMIKAFDVWGKKQFMGKIFDGIIRNTFVINEKGIISRIVTDVETKNHTEQLLETI